MRTSQIDLHSHSTASDGTLTPAGLVARAAAAGVRTLALTDHDSLDGVEEAAAAARQTGLALMPGVEVSVSWGGLTVHILGLGVDAEDPCLRAGLAGLQTFRDWRATEIARRLARAGIADALAGAERFRTGRIISRTHFARYLVACGAAASVGDVFRRYLRPGKPGHVAGDWADLDAALEWIHGAGGVAVIAHPARYRLTRTKLARLIDRFKAGGGQAMEVVSGSHSRDETLHMAAVAREHRLLASQGSDYHGPENPWIDLGRLRPMPAGCEPVWDTDPCRRWLEAA
jgi:predicted metal-dependent phosphoesterase TrpH